MGNIENCNTWRRRTRNVAASAHITDHIAVVATIYLGQASQESYFQHTRWDRNKLAGELREGRLRQQFTTDLEEELRKVSANLDVCAQDPTPDRHNQLVFYAIREAGKKHFICDPSPP